MPTEIINIQLSLIYNYFIAHNNTCILILAYCSIILVLFVKKQMLKGMFLDFLSTFSTLG